MRINFTILLLIFFGNISKSQLLKDPIAKKMIVEGLDKTYNFEFKEADEIYEKLRIRFPNHPLYATLKHMQLYAQYAPIKDHPTAKAQYVKLLNQSIAQAEKLIEKNENDTEAIFFMLSSLGSLAAWQSDNDEIMKGVNTARKAFGYMKQGMKLTEKQSDFLYTTGLYNYYIEQYPEDHPIVKPFMIFFSDGNKKLGLQQLDACYQKAMFTSTESAYYSAYIYLKHESNVSKALKYINELVEKYPNNLLFKTRLGECFISQNKYEQAETIVQALLKTSGKVYPITAQVFEGILQEKWKKDDKEALLWYAKALKTPMDIRFTQDYHAMAHLGLGRIYMREGKKEIAKTHFKTALKLSEYKSTSMEAKRWLNN